jgi:hypothetical protein
MQPLQPINFDDDECKVFQIVKLLFASHDLDELAQCVVSVTTQASAAVTPTKNVHAIYAVELVSARGIYSTTAENLSMPSGGTSDNNDGGTASLFT